LHIDMGKEIQYILYNLPDNTGTVQAYVEDETLWLTQKAMAQLFGVEVNTINYLCLGIDAPQHVGGSLVRRILRHELTLHSKVENLGFSIVYNSTQFFL